jgi:2-C-methyl-D-erythritol 4-phosphate cytidylyltransferase
VAARPGAYTVGPMHDMPPSPSPRHHARRCFALVPCAGIGARSGAPGPKQYSLLAGRPMVAHTLAALGGVRRLTATLVVLAPGDTAFRTHLPGSEGERCWLADCGGATRAETVGNGLEVLRTRGARDDDWVLVHDAARCLVRPDWVDALIDACLADEVGGLLAQPVADTLKDEADGRVVATVPRAHKWQAQTPQMFPLGLLAKALAAAGDAVTDEASAIEALGLAPRLVAAPAENFKVTFPPDFELAERLLRTRPP